MNTTDTNQLEISTEVKIGNSVYIVERHFNGGRSLTDAVYEAVKNEAVRRESEEQKHMTNL